MYKFSIIIPHKDVPSLLRRCLDSIPHREDMQIIVVDDNSDAENVDFVNFPGLNEKNTEVYFTKEGRGAGYARNVGLRYAKGEWVLFADADDMYMEGFCRILDFIAISTSDIVFFRSTALNCEDLSPVKEYNFAKRLDEIYKECANDVNQLRGLTQVPWGKAIRRVLIESHNVEFEEVRYANDVRFNAIVDYYAKSVEVCDIVGYCWMIRPTSLYHKKTLLWAETRFNVMLGVSKFYRSVEDKNREEIYTTQAHNYLGNILRFSKWKYYKYLFSFISYIGVFKFMNSWIKKRVAKGC